MKSILEYLSVKRWPSESQILEMATIDRRVRMAGAIYRVAIHGPLAGDRANPHIHIYLSSDVRPYNRFNFEISLCDILCRDQVNIIKMRDESRHTNRRGRANCSWQGYEKLRKDFEDWLFSKPSSPLSFDNNLTACIYFYNMESDQSSPNPLKNYMAERGWKVLPKYAKCVEEGGVG